MQQPYKEQSFVEKELPDVLERAANWIREQGANIYVNEVTAGWGPQGVWGAIISYRPRMPEPWTVDEPQELGIRL